MISDLDCELGLRIRKNKSCMVVFLLLPRDKKQTMNALTILHYRHRGNNEY